MRDGNYTKNGKCRKYGRMAVCGLLLMLLTGGCASPGILTVAGVQQNGGFGQRRPEKAGGESREPGQSISRIAEESGGSQEDGKPQQPGPEPAGFGSVPYFKDDSGSNTQLSEGWLYGYWGRQLCRVNLDTLESEVLFQAKSPQEGHFSIYDGNVYFVEQRSVSYLDGAKANLWRVRCDGSGLKLLVEDFDITESYAVGTSTLNGMEIYDGILYLLAGGANGEDNRYYHLRENGSAEEASADETLYGRVPEGYKDACRNYRFVRLPNLVYCMRNFGYAFLCDESGSLFRLLPETGELERVSMNTEGVSSGILLTNRGLVYRDYDDMWYNIGLEDLENPVEIGRMVCFDIYDIAFWDDKGIYNIDRGYSDGFSVERLNWDGESEMLSYWVQNPRLRGMNYLKVLYSDGSYLYYDSLSGGNGVICRIPLEDYEGFDEPEQVFTYYEDAAAKLSTRETFATTFTVESTGDCGSFSVTKVYLTENTEAAVRINEQLEEVYRFEEEYMAELMDDVRDIAADGEMSVPLYGSMLRVEDELSASIRYLDENYIDISLDWYEYWNGAAHGMYGSVDFVFSRSTGKLLQVTDVVENSSEEICSIIAPYVEAVAEWGTDEEGWEQMILEEGRFYLTSEGIGIHFDTYELTCYASGGLDVVVPFEMFRIRNPKEAGGISL